MSAAWQGSSGRRNYRHDGSRPPRVQGAGAAHGAGGRRRRPRRGPEAARAPRPAPARCEPRRLPRTADRGALRRAERQLCRSRTPEPRLAAPSSAQCGSRRRAASRRPRRRIPAASRTRRARPRDLRAARRGRAGSARDRRCNCGCGGPALGGSPVVRTGAGRSRVRATRAGRSGAAGRAPAGGGRAADRRRTGAGPPPRPRPRARGAGGRAPVPRTLSRPADARALPLRPPGGRARGLSAHEDADGQRAGPQARGGAPAARTGDPRAGPGVEHLRRRARECAVTASGGLSVQGPSAVRAD